MVDGPDDKPSRRADGLPAGSPPPVPIRREELLRQEAELAASMQSKLDQACLPALPATPGGNKLGARKDASFKAICTAPSINWTPAGSGQVPVPYQTVQDLSNSVSTARTVRFNGLPAYLLDQTTQPKGTGDERGTGKGVRSGTVTGEVKPVSGCTTVRIEGKQIVREGDKCMMNGENNPGIYTAPSTSASWKKWKDTTKRELLAAKKKPLSAILGAVKDFINTVPATTETLLRSIVSARATELEQAAIFQSIAGNHEAGDLVSSIAKETSKISGSIELPELKIIGDAEHGGQKISVVLQVAAAGAGIARMGVRGLVSARKPVNSQATQASTGVKVASIANVRKVRSAEEINKEMLEAGNLPAWMEGTSVITEEIQAGEQFYMVVAEGQLKGLLKGEPWFGGWATPDPVPNQLFARQKLAILEKFKADVSAVVKVEVTAPQKINRGITGPMESYPGGARQVEFVGSRNLKIVGQPVLLPKE